MHSKRNHRPRWALLNLIMLATVGGLALEHSLHLTPLGHKITLFLVITVIYGLMALWVKSNATTLENLDAEEYRRQSRDPSPYGTPTLPSRTQADFQETVSFYGRETLDKQEKR